MRKGSALADYANLEIRRYFLYLYVTLEGKLPVKARSTLFTGLGTMLYDDAAPERVA